MKHNYSSTSPNTSPHYASHPFKNNHPNVQPRLSHQVPSNNSSKDISIKKEDLKDHKFLNTYSPNYISSQKKTNNFFSNKTEDQQKSYSPYI